MTEPLATLEGECRVLTRFLIGTDPDDTTIRHYQDAHRSLARLKTGHRFEALTVRFARLHPWCARAADGYAVFFAPQGVLRHKLVTLLAILETTGSTSRMVDQASGAPLWWVLVRLVSGGVMSFAFAAIGTVCLLPFRLLYGSPRADG